MKRAAAGSSSSGKPAKKAKAPAEKDPRPLPLTWAPVGFNPTRGRLLTENDFDPNILENCKVVD